MSVLAITGGTGFVGATLIDLALARGYQVRALTRRPQPPRSGIVWIEGALDRPESLAKLVQGCDAVIHVAGVINGSDEEFHLGNVVGTEKMIDAAAQAGIKRFIHVSSLAAREPGLSAYGRSKCASEESVIASGGDWTIVRPPAIYGPRDRELLELFRVARLGVVPLPPGGHLSVIAVADLARLLLDCIQKPASIARIFEPDDGRDGGWPHADFVRLIGKAIGRKKILPLPIPQRLLRWGASADGLIRRGGAKLTPDRVAYFCHPDWTASPARRPPAELWAPEVETEQGLAETAAWYRAEGWL
ncbi:NAD(P)H-binding protein [Sphingomonas sp. BIUV-7]|uniref:NAD(P)H-binding protein n=1 Tax=Sphingomonas natans TaxID=3063330 RepID=A0ABT8Y8B6_9SPHN|nr:NAD(P)H-binding protein [Sphingomonas sp. BIUV-7]MDO6413969.1 NAD(P)H-binding protein [Sphingomonas sp. BIUV-7]